MIEEPASPGIHQSFCLASGFVMKVKHAAWTAAARAAFAVAIEKIFLIEKIHGLVQNGF
jgi:hypothetical protein